MILALIVLPMLAILALLGLVACAPENDLGRYALPAIRTVALLAAATVFVAAVWSP